MTMFLSDALDGNKLLEHFTAISVILMTYLYKYRKFCEVLEPIRAL